MEGRLSGREINPRAIRVEVEYDALLRFDCAVIGAQILNVSSDGFRLRSAEELEPGMEVTVEVEKLEPVRAKIRWTCGHESGGVFLDPIAL